MSGGAKARLTGWVVAFLLVWPALHFQLVTRLDVNPWKLCGFAMYCTPWVVEVDVFDVTDGHRRRIRSRDLPEAARGVFDEWLRYRYALGRLQATDALARAIFAARPQTRELQVGVTIERIRWRETEAHKETRVYRHRRDDVL